MNIPTVLTSGCHLDLSLSGNKIAVLESVKLKSLAKSGQKKHSLNQTEVLPSITPSCESATPDHTITSYKPKPLGLAKEVNHVLSKERSLELELQKFRSAESKAALLKLPVTPKNKPSFCTVESIGSVSTPAKVNQSYVQENGSLKLDSSGKWFSEPDIVEQVEQIDREASVTLKEQDPQQVSSESPPDCVDECTGNTADDVWEDVEDIENENLDLKTAPTKHKKLKKKHRRSKSKQSNKNMKVSKLKTTAEVYTDLTLLERTSQIEASCYPAKILKLSPQKPRNKVDYSRYVNDKAPCATKTKVTSTNSSEILLRKTKELIHNITLRTFKNSSKASPEKSSAGADKTAPKLLSTSADPITFKLLNVRTSLTLQRKSLGSAPSNSVVPRMTKVYLSEKQSKDVEELGVEIPAAPPCTPTPDMLVKFEYVPCMADIRAQRAVKMKLDFLVKIENQRKQKLKEEKIKKEKTREKERVKELRKQQRREIYALNQKMMEFEHKNFAEFCHQNDMPVMT